MANNPNSVNLGACAITWGGTYLGFTKGGVDVSVRATSRKTNVDHFGPVEIIDLQTDKVITVRAMLAESDLLTFQNMMLQSATLDAGGLFTTIGANYGVNLATQTQPLILHPETAADASTDLTIPLASQTGTLQWSYRIDAERVFQVEWTGYPDSAGRLAYYGETTQADAVLRDSSMLTLRDGTVVELR